MPRPAWDIVLCFWARRHFILTVPLSIPMKNGYRRMQCQGEPSDGLKAFSGDSTIIRNCFILQKPSADFTLLLLLPSKQHDQIQETILKQLYL